VQDLLGDFLKRVKELNFESRVLENLEEKTINEKQVSN
jgi:hypothetical protein